MAQSPFRCHTTAQMFPKSLMFRPRSPGTPQRAPCRTGSNAFVRTERRASSPDCPGRPRPRSIRTAAQTPLCERPSPRPRKPCNNRTRQSRTRTLRTLSAYLASTVPLLVPAISVSSFAIVPQDGLSARCWRNASRSPPNDRKHNGQRKCPFTGSLTADPPPRRSGNSGSDASCARARSPRPCVSARRPMPNAPSSWSPARFPPRSCTTSRRGTRT
jgi:hypothetical protein